MSSTKISIVILNWNALEMTKRCVESVRKQKHPYNIQLILIDNGSSDGSIEWIAAQSDLTLISNSRNLGFARAINQGFDLAIDSKCDYVIALNNDTLLHQGWIKKLVNYMMQNTSIGFAQGATMQMNHTDLYDSTGIYLERGFIPNQRALGQPNARLEIPVIGPNAAGAIYRTTMLNEIAISKGQYFDNRFFAYVEDVDMNLRCTVRGYEFGFVAEAKLYHVGSATGNKIAKKKMFWGSRNLVWLVYKNAPLSLLRRTGKMIIRSHAANLQFLWRDQRANFKPYLGGLIVGLLMLPLFTLKRRKNLKAQTINNNEFYNLLIASNPPLINPLRKLLNLIR